MTGEASSFPRATPGSSKQQEQPQLEGASISSTRNTERLTNLVSSPSPAAAYSKMLHMTLELAQDIGLHIRVGDSVMTSYGVGTLKKREKEKMEIQLSFGTFYTHQSDMIHKVLTTDQYEQTMDHLEQIRELQLAVQCQEWNIQMQDGACVACMFHKPELNAPKPSWRRRPRRRIGGKNELPKASQNCDVCGNPVCNQHKIIPPGDSACFCMCVDCSHDLNQAEHQLNPHHPQLQQTLDRLTQHYLRMNLQLNFMIPILPNLAKQLAHKQRRDAQIRVGTSGLGFVGAALGVAGAVSMLTPAGPAVLLAAVAASATSGTLQATHTTYNALSISQKQQHQVADRCVGWHGLCLGIVQALEQLRFDLLTEQQQHQLNSRLGFKRLHANQHSLDVWNALAVGSFTTTRNAMTGVGVTPAMGASYSQAINTSLQGIPVVGAAFSVGCMAMDAGSIYSHLKDLQHPAQKSVALLHVTNSFPRTIPNSIAHEVEIIQDAVNDLNDRLEEQRTQQERDLIEKELEGMQEEELRYEKELQGIEEELSKI